MSINYKSVSVIGLGYIGLPTAAIVANRGINVIGVDNNPDVVNVLKTGNTHIAEPDLDILVHAAVNSGSLKVVSTPEKSDIFIIAVPTPFKENHKPDISYIDNAIKSIASIIEKNNLIILESTSPVGTTEYIANLIAELRPDLQLPLSNKENADVNIAYCPERVLPGKILQELVENDRIIGGISDVCSEKAKEFYKIFVKGNCIITNSRTAEMTKLTENAFRDVNIAFANELSIICDEIDINVWELINLANRHPRVSILQPGPGVGGHCIAVDPWFIIDAAPKQSKLLRVSREVNDSKPDVVIKKISDEMRKYDNPVVACLGLSFKANIDDLRESAALKIVHNLVNSNTGNYLVVEPYINKLPIGLADNVNVKLVDIDTALDSANIILGLVEHSEFINISSDRLLNKSVVDTKGIWKTK